MVFQCQCKHNYQDQLYGKGNRVHNSCVKGYRCTVCGNVVGSGANKEASKKEPEK